MIKYRILCLIVLLGGISGCQKAQLESKPKPKPNTGPVYLEHDINVAELPDLVTFVFKLLSITLEEVNQKNNRFEWIGRSLSEENVNVQAFALIKGKSVLRIEVRGEWKVSYLLRNEIQNGLNDAIRNKNSNSMNN
jgi:hypothetical protein